MAQTFSALKVLHERLDELFLLHQESLLDQTGDGGEWADRSLALLDRYEAALREHLRLEEELLLPVYRRAGKIPGGPEEFYTGEHARLLTILARCRGLLLELRRGELERRRGTIRLFDEESVFKSLTQHHHQREENLLFPTLDEVADESERTRLIRLCLGAEGDQ